MVACINDHVKDACSSEQKIAIYFHEMSITFIAIVLDSHPKYKKPAEMMTFQNACDILTGLSQAAR